MQDSKEIITAFDDAINTLQALREVGVKRVEVAPETLAGLMRPPRVVKRSVTPAEPPVQHKLIAVVTSAYLEGEDELAQSSRFEGKAGEMLDKMFAVIGLTRKELYITAAVKAFGKPTPQQLQASREPLRKELHRIAPKVVVLMGPQAVKALYQDATASGRVGQWNRTDGFMTIALHHPARLLMLSETVARPMKYENLNALRAIQQFMKEH